MAKRHATFEGLNEWLAEETQKVWKPSDTLGRHHAVVVRQENDLVVVGSVKGRVTLYIGDTLGYDRGEVWLVPQPDSYRDPIRRVLALAKISQRCLVYTNEAVEYTKGWDTSPYPNSACDLSRGEEVKILGDCHDGGDRGYDDVLRQEHHRLVGGDAILVYSIRWEATTTHRQRVPSRVIVRPFSDKAKVVEWLLGQLFPEPITRNLTLKGVKVGPGFKVIRVRTTMDSWSGWAGHGLGRGEVTRDGDFDPLDLSKTTATYVFRVYKDSYQRDALGGVVMVYPGADSDQLADMIAELVKEGLPDPSWEQELRSS